jgi:hypothetical protein
MFEIITCDDFTRHYIITAYNHMLKGKYSVQSAMLSLEPTNIEGCDRIPQHIMLDGVDIQLAPMTKLFTLIYYGKKIFINH